MKALVIEQAGKAALHDIAEPVVGSRDVLVDVRHIGLCGSDLNTFSGANPLVSLPRVPGHEIGGKILAVGADVPADFARGKNVIVIPYTQCGQCSSCRKGRFNACRYNRTLGVQQDGELAERIALPFDKLILNETLPAPHLALVEPLSVGFHAASRGKVAAGDKVVVLGCGMIGMGAILAAASMGAEVIAIDLSHNKEKIALGLGADYFIAADAPDLAERISILTGGDGADVVIEAVGIPQTFTQAVDFAGFAGRVVYIGYCKTAVTYETRFLNLKELDIHGSRNANLADFQAVIAALGRLGTKADQLVTRIFPFQESANALPFWIENRDSTVKIIIERL